MPIILRRLTKTCGHLLIAMLAGLFFMTASVQAEYPDRPIKLVVPFPGGGNSDILARVLAEGMSKQLGETVVVENKPGAAGQIGNQYILNAKPDGYTLLLGGMSTQILLVGTAPELPYDPLHDFEAVALTSKVPVVLVVPGNSPASTIEELAEMLRESPGAYNFSSAGTGTSGHIMSQHFADSIGAEVVHVPYKGSAPAMVDLIAGRNAYLIDTPAVVKELVADGKIKALGVFTEQRLPDFPDVPTINETPIADDIQAQLAPWQGIFVRSGVPAETKEKIAQAVLAALEMPEIKENLEQLGFVSLPGGVAEAQALFESDFEVWLPILEEMELQAQ